MILLGDTEVKVGAISISVKLLCFTLPFVFELTTGRWLPATGLVITQLIVVLVTVGEHFLPAHSILSYSSSEVPKPVPVIVRDVKGDIDDILVISGA